MLYSPVFCCCSRVASSCANPGCTNARIFTDPRSQLPLCSLACHRAVHASGLVEKTVAKFAGDKAPELAHLVSVAPHSASASAHAHAQTHSHMTGHAHAHAPGRSHTQTHATDDSTAISPSKMAVRDSGGLTLRISGRSGQQAAAPSTSAGSGGGPSASSAAAVKSPTRGRKTE